MVDLPTAFKYVWQDFLVLNSSRTSNGFGVNPLSYVEIKAYYDLHQQVPEPWEITIIRYFDAVVMNVYAERAKQDQQKAQKK